MIIFKIKVIPRKVGLPNLNLNFESKAALVDTQDSYLDQSESVLSPISQEEGKECEYTHLKIFSSSGPGLFLVGFKSIQGTSHLHSS